MKAFTSLLAVLLLLSSTSLAQTVPGQEATQNAAPPTQTADPTPQAAAAPQPPAAPQQVDVAAAQPDTASQPTPSAPPSAEPAPVVTFGPGAKLYLEPMNGFEQLLAEAITKKKVPVVLVHERDQADFVVTGDAYVKKPGWIKGNFVYLHGQANISVDNARTGGVVFAYTAKRVDANLVDGEVYKIWAGGCANHLKKALVKK